MGSITITTHLNQNFSVQAVKTEFNPNPLNSYGLKRPSIKRQFLRRRANKAQGIRTKTSDKVRDRLSCGNLISIIIVIQPGALTYNQ